MKNSFKTILACVLICGIAYLVGCTVKDVDFNNIDMTTSVSTSLSLPIGAMSIKFGDFIGASSLQNIRTEIVDGKERYFFTDTLQVARSYHPIDLSDYVSTTSSQWDMHNYINQLADQLEDKLQGIIPGVDFDLEKWFEQYGSVTIPEGCTFDLEFPIELDLTKLNLDYNYQRVDSIIVDSALFTSQFILGNIDFDWSSIQDIQLILNDKFRYTKGDTINLLQTGKDFGHAMPIALSSFHLVLMKDAQAESSATNIIDSLNLNIRFQIHNTKPITIHRDSYIGYDFELAFIDYSAMYGYFAASDLMHDEMFERSINDLWSGWQVFDNWILPANEPSVTFIVDHTLAVPMLVDLKHLYTLSMDGERRDATFDENKTITTKSIPMPAQIAVTDPLEKHAYNTITLDYTPENGNIDTLLSIHPHSVSYAFDVSTDTTTAMKQFRITDNTDINLAAILNIPFSFNDSVHIVYSDTIHDVNLTQLQLDSLIKETKAIKEIKEAELQLYIAIDNSIPFAINAAFTLYDANNQIVQLSAMDSTTFEIHIDNPDVITNGIATTPSTNKIPTITIRKDDFDALASIKYIVFDATLGDNHEAVTLSTDAAIRFQLGITADMDAIIDLEEIF